MRIVKAKVRALKHDMADVEVLIDEGGCGRCHEKGGCGGKNIARSFCSQSKFLTIKNTLQLSIGDEVYVGLEERTIAVFATRFYAVPLFGIITGAGTGNLIAESTGAVLGSIFGLILAIGFNSLFQPPAPMGPRMIEKQTEKTQ